ncbi:hypothetical protein T11_60 [Trichinella zimbabwensis]|uniref:Mitochondrial mRNA-processing protein COX24 C-terminal domain-containing protein n=1 Tax=Trichinella zimbabwensis TaxID=268475 RepID=A0A0V1H3B8_9BILA|nr:hypothetical protein T11_60 [Trichinella zimbabwensis]
MKALYMDSVLAVQSVTSMMLKWNKYSRQEESKDNFENFQLGYFASLYGFVMPSAGNVNKHSSVFYYNPSAASLPVVEPPSCLISLLVPNLNTQTDCALQLPPHPASVKKLHAHRMLRIRRRKIKKHWRMKRYRRRRVIYLRLHAEKKQKSENAFRARMNELLREALQFSAEKYVETVISRSKWKPTEERLPDGRRKYPHWTELMTIEELYGLSNVDYIDKKSCTADKEDFDAILKLRQKYKDTFGKLV